MAVEIDARLIPQELLEYFEPVVEGQAVPMWAVPPGQTNVFVLNPEASDLEHYALMPTRLIEPCVKAGTSEKGVCEKCGAPWARVVEREKLTRPRPNDYVKRTGELGTGNSCANSVAGVSVKTTGWRPTCGCYDARAVEFAATANFPRSKKPKHVRAEDVTGRWAVRSLRQSWRLCEQWAKDQVPATVCDPFSGLATVGVVALRLRRNFLGLELNPQYAAMSEKRLSDPAAIRGDRHRKPRKQPEHQQTLGL